MDAQRLSELVDRHAAALTLYARQWCSSPEDVVQTAFLKLARLPSVPENLLPWLYRVVRNAAIDASRASRRRQKYESLAAEASPHWFEPTDDPTGLDGQTVTLALQELPPDIREIMIAHLWGGLTFEQIAEMVGGSASTAYRRFSAGLNLLRERLRIPCPMPKKTRA